jgi:hypothetical protein
VHRDLGRGGQSTGTPSAVAMLFARPAGSRATSGSGCGQVGQRVHRAVAAGEDEAVIVGVVHDGLELAEASG